ncbi:acyl-CoA dehydrogenase family protein [Pseudonocardia sp. KRD291]|uniref:acyl-CoA dehydrogenase family protein n=1 Tax=Pseudonocardia sp. KRD291 TaxID=2792007 RepID=UPI001C4A495A|nr:acyl-CoA dehydrogenase family protein [Pseudonocardia sp. KRD291]MBW0105178.1 acyl-CoA dehydrogenase family protein [Pseudonocardia sp. KRD291]MDN5913956.1 acyl-CoA dehydrogenase family protein [Pseudonocardia sp.]
MTGTELDLEDVLPTGAWELPEEFVLLRETVREFVETEVHPLEDTLPHDTAGVPQPQLGELQHKARKMGLWALATPREFGGAGLSVLGQVVIGEEAAKCRMGAFFPAGGAFGGNPPNVMYKASTEQFDRFARPIIEGRMSKAYTAISEATGGSDPAGAIRCRAVRDGDEYVLTGTKLWTSHAGNADWGVVYARTGEAGARDGISCFIVEQDTPGLTMTPIGVMNSFSPYELHFDGVRVPAANRIGDEGAGFRLASEFLVHGRIVYAAGPIGIAQYALGLAVDWVKRRQVFGEALADKQAVQFMVADSEIELRAARLLMYQAAWNADLGKDVKVDASVCKVFGTETAFRVVDRCVQLFGAMGLSQEMPLERWFRDLRVKLLGEGASEVQRMVIARRLLR